MQQKSEVRYITKRSLRNGISHTMAVAVSHYQIGKKDKRMKKIEHTTAGAQLLYKLVKKENKGLALYFVIPMIISIPDGTTVFALECYEDSSYGEGCIICKDEDTGTRSAYTHHTSSTVNVRGLRIYHSVTFNAYSDATP